MKVLKAYFFLGFSLLVIVFVFSGLSRAETLSRYDKEEYFPHKIGTRWVYEITTGDEEPTYCNPIFWTRKDGSESVQEMRGILPGYKSYQKSYKLIISIWSVYSAYLEGFDLPSGWRLVRLEIEKDELGIFKDTDSLFSDRRDVYWALDENYSEDFVVILLTTYNPRIISGNYSLYNDSSGDRKPPYNKRVIFFAKDPDFVFTIGEDPKEDLGYVGVDGPELYFIRSVKKAKDTKEFSFDSYKAENQDFKEHMWFAKGKGLTRLVQRRDEKTTMIWKLTEFSQGY